MGSPRGVAVPCMPRPARASGPMRASCRAAFSTSDCAGPFGAVRALLRPSCVSGKWIAAKLSEMIKSNDGIVFSCTES